MSEPSVPVRRLMCDMAAYSVPVVGETVSGVRCTCGAFGGVVVVLVVVRVRREEVRARRPGGVN